MRRISCYQTCLLPLSAIGSLLLWIISSNAFADDPGKPSGQDEENRQTEGYLEAGIGYQSEDSFWFGRYSGLTEEGIFLTGDLDIDSRTDSGSHTQLTGRRLGLESQSILLEQGTQGLYTIRLRHDGWPDYYSNSGVTPYIDAGDNILVLNENPADPQSYRTVELYTLRKRNSAAIEFIPEQHWKTSFSYRQDKKEGTRQTGGALGYSTRNMAMALLPGQVEYTTNLIDASLGYAKGKGNIELSYHLSMFRNDNQSLSWQNPFPDTTGNSGATGQLALEPDNDFQQVMLSGGYRLPMNSYLSGTLSSGLMTQDQAFLPYTTNPQITTPSLPYSSLDGEVKQNIAQLKLTSRPLRNWHFNASYRYHEHDNNTPQATYTFPVNDSLPPGKRGKDEEDLSAINQPLSYTRETTRLDGKYRFTRGASLQLGYDKESDDREFSDVDHTDENTLWGKLKLKSGSERVDGWLKLGRVIRDGSGYHLPAVGSDGAYVENPLLRKYNLADMERDEVRMLVNFNPLDRLSFSANFAYSDDQYSESLIGLTSANNRSASIEASYIPSDRVTTYAYYTHDLIDSEQAGRESLAESDGSLVERYGPDWFAQTQDVLDSYGLGIQWADLLPKTDFGMDYLYSKGQGETQLQLDGASPFPDIQTRLQSISLYARYRKTAKLSWKLDYTHEEYSSQDWALDGVQPVSADSPTSLFMAESSPQYNVDIVMLSLRYTF